MKFLGRALLLFPSVALALLVPACESIHVAPWPYTLETADAAATEGGATTDGGTSADASGQGLTGIQANYGPDPLRCDGGLCDTDNYSLCTVAHTPAESRAVWPLSGLFVVAGLVFACKRSGRKARRSS